MICSEIPLFYSENILDFRLLSVSFKNRGPVDSEKQFSQQLTQFSQVNLHT